MATTVPVIKARMGTTDYFCGIMDAGELIDTVGYASEIPEWKEMSIEERMQRDIDPGRVALEIVPYLQEDPDRFFGALLVDIYQGWEDLEFEPLTEVAKQVPKRYAQELERFGFLHMPGQRRIIALDGQHRLKALSMAIRGDQKYNITPAPELSKESITVIFIKHENNDQKIRKIFNKVNRYAKPTNRGDNIITSEDDPIAILSRRLLRPGEPLAGEQLVNWKSNTLAAGSLAFTTISTIYDTIESILEDELTLGVIAKRTRPSDEDLDKYYEKVVNIWRTVLNGTDQYQNMLHNPNGVKEQRKISLLFKPAAQMALFRGLKKAMDTGVKLETAVDRINSIPWEINDPLWKGWLIAPNGNIDAGKETKKLVARIIAYYLSNEKSEDPNLLQDYRDRTGNPTAELPVLAASVA